MTFRLNSCSVCFSLLLLYPPLPAFADSESGPPLKLAMHIQDAHINQAAYFVSEKYDGVRAWWDGQRLLTRSGRTIQAPESFTRGFPTVPLDGELWLGRGRFAEVSGLVRRDKPTKGWEEVRYMVFDMPEAGGDFEARYEALGRQLDAVGNPHIERVHQAPVSTTEQLLAHLSAVTGTGGEGLMLQRRDAPYRRGRSDDLIKLTAQRDAEARVVAHLPGKGKYEGALGALLVEDTAGRRFRIGSGFSDLERTEPPPPGTQITYRYTGETATGLPRFPRFLRLRPEE